MLLAELGLLPLQVLWWRQALRFWNGLAALPVGSFYHTVCLDSLTDAFQGGACNMASSVAGCLSSVGYDMPRVFDVIPLLEIDSIVEALTVQLQDAPQSPDAGSLIQLYSSLGAAPHEQLQDPQLSQQAVADLHSKGCAAAAKLESKPARHHKNQTSIN
ncbi:TPA: hypothetical protein ACH3X3_005582 [Trebouxia sp. C0006]